MQIVIKYRNGKCPRVISTSGESMLSQNSILGSLEWQNALDPQPMIGTHMRVRTDVATEGGPLLIEVMSYSSAVDDYIYDHPTEIADFGAVSRAYIARTHIFRVIKALRAEEMEDVIDLRSDGVWLHRFGDKLVDMTAYECMEQDLLSNAEIQSNPLAKRVLMVHDILKQLHPDVNEREISQLYGMDNTLFDFANIVEGRMVLYAGGGDEGHHSLAGHPRGVGSNLEDALQNLRNSDNTTSLQGPRTRIPSLPLSESRASVDDCPFDLEDQA